MLSTEEHTQLPSTKAHLMHSHTAVNMGFPTPNHLSSQSDLDELDPFVSTTTLSSQGSNTRRRTFTADSQNAACFVYRHDKKHHGYPKSLVPYPLNYERATLDSDALDHSFRMQIFDGNPSVLPWIKSDNPSTHPSKCLDLGCGTGSWIISAAQIWTKTQFVGFDLVDNQPNILAFDDRITALDKALRPAAPTLGAGTNQIEPGIQKLGGRVRWVHGNFLAKPLPFEDGEFDHVHISCIGKGVPEDKWDNLFSEITRILSVGGSFEMFEEDIVFPIFAKEPPPNQSSTSIGLSEKRRPSLGAVSKNSRHSTASSDLTSSEGFSSRLSLSSSRFLVNAPPKPPPLPTPPPHLSLLMPSDLFTPPSNNATIRSAPKIYNGPGGVGVGGPVGTRSRQHGMKPPEPAIPDGFDGPRSAPPVPSPHRPATAGSTKPPSRRTTINSSIFQSLSNKTRNHFSYNSLTIKSRPHTSSSAMGSLPSPSHSQFPNSQPGTVRSYSVPAVPLQQPLATAPNHDHHVLETLFFGAFERRFINTTPTAIIPSYLSLYFQNVLTSPSWDFPTPPIPKSSQLKPIQNFSHPFKPNNPPQPTTNGKTNGQQVISPKGTARSPTQPAHHSPRSPGKSPARKEPSKDNRNAPLKRSKSYSVWPARANSRSDSVSSMSEYNSSPSSKNHSPLPTPVTPGTDPTLAHISPSITSPLRTHFSNRFAGGKDGDLRRVQSEDCYLRHQHNDWKVRPSLDEEEDARVAIMGEGGQYAPPSPIPGKTKDKYDTKLSAIDAAVAAVEHIEEAAEDQEEEEDDYGILQWREEDILYHYNRHNRNSFTPSLNSSHHSLDLHDANSNPHLPESETAEEEVEWERPRRYVRPRRALVGKGLSTPSALMELDDRSMGVHLTRTWLNVIACKEAMWDELQRRAKTITEEVHPSMPVNNVPYQYHEHRRHSVRRVTLLDDIEWDYQERKMSDREKFEMLFQRFESDMRNWAAVGNALPVKLAWLDPSKHPKSRSENIMASKSSTNGNPSTDGLGPGRDGLVKPGLDTCRTVRVFTGMKMKEEASKGGKVDKLL